MIMDRRTAIKLTLATILNIGLFFLICFASFIYTNTLYGAVIGSLVGFIVMCLIIAYVYPIFFKDYIELFWQNEERKKCLEKEVES